MPVIGIIDDREDIRTTLKRFIDIAIKKQQLPWITIDIFPFKDKNDYISWIKENEISILILDEKLQEGSHSAANVDYNGSKLIEFIRNTLPEFPVFAITSYPKDPDLQKKFPLFDEILGRDDFFKRYDEYTTRFVRAGQRFVDVYNSQLSRLSDLSKKVAIGSANDSDLSEVKALQEYLNIPFASLVYTNREEWLKLYQSKMDELSNISARIKSFIEEKKK